MLAEPGGKERVDEIKAKLESMIAAYDLLIDDGMPSDDALRLVGGAERSGQDVEAFARHVIKLRRSIR
jgi:hypothetical protein